MFERAENMRYRFFVEPVLYVFLVAQATAVARTWGRRPPAHEAAPAESAR